jgi:hypothetical protein
MMENRHQGLADRPGHPGMDGGPEQENQKTVPDLALSRAAQQPGGLNRRVSKNLCSTCRRDILRLAACPINTRLLFFRTQMIPFPFNLSRF